MAKAHVEVGADLSPLEQALNAAKEQLKDWGGSVMAIGAGMAGLGAAITGPMLYGLSVFKEMGGEIAGAARISGMSLQDVQTLSFALKVSMEDLGIASKKMDKFISQAASGTPAATERLTVLGLSIDQLATLSEGDRIRTIGAAIEKTYKDVSQRHAATMEIFGKSALQLNFGGDVAKREQEVGRLGGVMSPEDVALAKEYGYTVRDLGIASSGLWARIGAAIAPTMGRFFSFMTEGIIFLQAFVDGNRGLLDIVFRVADALVLVGGIVGGGLGLYYLASFLGVFSTAAAVLSSTLSFVAGGFGMVTAATGAWNTVATVSSFLWGVLTALAVGIGVAWSFIASPVALLTLLMWGMNVAMSAWEVLAGVAAGITGLWSAALALLGVGAGAAAGATLGAKVAAWLYSVGASAASLATTILTAGVNLLVGALVILAAVLVAVPFVWLAGAIFATMQAAYSAAMATGAIGRAWDEVSTSISGALTGTWEAAKALFAGLVETATLAFGGIKDAMASGDWGLVWEIVKVSAKIAWTDITKFATAAWVAWKPAILEVFQSIVYAITDMFFAAWAEITNEFIRKMKWSASMVPGVGILSRVLPSVDEGAVAREQTERAAARSERDRRSGRFAVVGAAVTATPEEGSEAWLPPGGPSGTFAELQAAWGGPTADELHRRHLIDEAWWANDDHWNYYSSAAAGTNEIALADMGSVGSFSGAAISGFTGSSADRTAAATELTAERLVQVEEALQQILRTPGSLLIV